MTLANGDRMRKVDKGTGEPIPTEREGYTDFQIVDCSPTWLESVPAVLDAEGTEVEPKRNRTVQMVKFEKLA